LAIVRSLLSIEQSICQGYYLSQTKLQQFEMKQEINPKGRVRLDFNKIQNCIY
jgi:hypothetical protein